jgi:glutaredoxin 3
MAEVILYSTPSCPYCRMAKDFLDGEGVGFKAVDVSEDEKAAREMVDKSGQMGVPVMELGNVIIVGFDSGAYRKALVEAGILSEASEKAD